VLSPCLATGMLGPIRRVAPARAEGISGLSVGYPGRTLSFRLRRVVVVGCHQVRAVKPTGVRGRDPLAGGPPSQRSGLTARSIADSHNGGSRDGAPSSMTTHEASHPTPFSWRHPGFLAPWLPPDPVVRRRARPRGRAAWARAVPTRAATISNPGAAEAGEKASPR
jgi:hypothetical protein